MGGGALHNSLQTTYWPCRTSAKPIQPARGVARACNRLSFFILLIQPNSCLAASHTSPVSRGGSIVQSRCSHAGGDISAAGATEECVRLAKYIVPFFLKPFQRDRGSARMVFRGS